MIRYFTSFLIVRGIVMITSKIFSKFFLSLLRLYQIIPRKILSIEALALVSTASDTKRLKTELSPGKAPMTRKPVSRSAVSCVSLRMSVPLHATSTREA